MCFRILRWNEHPGLASGLNVIIRLLIKRGETRGPKLEILEKALLPALKGWKMSQGMHVLRGRLTEEQALCLEPPSDTLISGLVTFRNIINPVF